MLKKLLNSIKKRTFRKILRKYDSIVMYGFVLVIVSIRGDFVSVRKMRDGKLGNLRLCDVVIKRNGKDFRLSDVKLLDFFRN